MKREFVQRLEYYLKAKHNIITEMHKDYSQYGFGPGLENEHFKFTFNVNSTVMSFYQYGQNQSCAEEQMDKQLEIHCPELSI